MKRTILVCEDCDRIFTGRVRDDGSTILPLDGSSCHCGNEAFATVEGVGSEALA